MGRRQRQMWIRDRPTTVIIDRNGNKRLLHLGYRAGDEKKYEKALKILMRE